MDKEQKVFNDLNDVMKKEYESAKDRIIVRFIAMILLVAWGFYMFLCFRTVLTGIFLFAEIIVATGVSFYLGSWWTLNETQEEKRAELEERSEKLGWKSK